MSIDWDSVKIQTLWTYEDLISKLRNVIGYGFVQDHYDHDPAQAREYAMAIRSGYLHDQGEMVVYIDGIVADLEMLEASRLGPYSEILRQVSTRELCLAFLQRTGIEFDRLIQTLNYLLRWVLPFKAPLREFIDLEDGAESGIFQALKKQKIASNLDLLEIGRTSAGRLRLASTPEVALDLLTALVHRADISRLAYVRGKTVMHLCAGGYDTLEKIARASLPEMEPQMDAYYHTLGKSLDDFKSVIPLSWMIGGAGVLPRVVSD